MNELADLVQWLRTDPYIHTSRCSQKAHKSGTKCQVDCTCYITQKRLQAETVQLAMGRAVDLSEMITDRPVFVQSRCAQCKTPTRFDTDMDSIRCEVCTGKYIEDLERESALYAQLGNGFSSALMKAEKDLKRSEREKDALHDQIERLEDMAERRVEQMEEVSRKLRKTEEANKKLWRALGLEALDIEEMDSNELG